MANITQPFVGPENIDILMKIPSMKVQDLVNFSRDGVTLMKQFKGHMK